MINRLFTGALLMLCAFSVFAARNCPPDTKFWTSGGDTKYSSPTEACANNPLLSGYVNVSAYQWGVDYYKCAQSVNGQALAFVNLVLRCSDGSNPDAQGMCECPDPCKKWSGMYHNGGSPSGVRLPGGDAGGDRNYYSGSGSEVPVSICIDNCTAAFAGTDDFAVVAGNNWSVAANPIFTGKSCGETTSQGHRLNKTTPEYDCVVSGKAFGYINGVVSCVAPKAGKDSNTTSKTTSNADGTSTKVDVTKVISCSGDGSCVTQTTTTTTTISASGVPGTSYTNQTVEKTSGTSASPSGNSSGNSSFCSDNPQSPLCSKGSFSGACGSAPVCEGDPVQCATAKAVFEQNCKSLPPGEPVDNEGAVGSKKVNVGSIVPDNFLPSDGTCIPDKVITIQGRQYVWNMSLLCDYAHGIRPAVILIAWVAALYIVFGRGTTNNA